MKPEANEMGKWLNEIHKTNVYERYTYSELDIEALGECFVLFLGCNNIKERMDEFTDYKEFKKFFNQSVVSMAYANLEEWKISLQRGLHGRKTITGYGCESHFTVNSIDPKFRNYSFEIWHDVHNTQVMINKGDKTHFIRIMWDNLYQSIYEYYSTKVKLEQLNLFNFVA